MIDITKLLCGTVSKEDVLRYGRRSDKSPAGLLRFSADKKPVVVWNTTRRCNLKCIHCYSNSENKLYSGELTTNEAKEFIKDLAKFKAPVLLFSGGEPLIRKDIFELGKLAHKLGVRCVISTNGTLITKKIAKKIKQANFSYVGVSLDGLKEINDKFRGLKGAFKLALRGIRNLLDEKVKVGLRFTLNKHNYRDLENILNLAVKEGIPRLCIYHLVYSGRGSKLKEADLSLKESRSAVDLILKAADEFFKQGKDIDILTVDNHTDGVYLYLKLKKKDPERAAEVLELLRYNGGNSSGVGIGCVDNRGFVHADQFWGHYSFGNVKERPFSQIWMDVSDSLMKGLKKRKSLLKGRCALCKYLDICNGNFRVRAEAIYGDVWAPDPACYLNDKEIGVKK